MNTLCHVPAVSCSHSGRAKAREEMAVIMHKDAIPTQSKDRSFFQGVMTHYMFILAILALVSGLANIGFVILKLPAAMAMLPGFSLLSGVLLWMAIGRTSIVGAPGFSFPPAAGVVLLPLTTLALLVDCYLHFESYKEHISPIFVALMVVPHVVVHGFGAMHRKLGYSEAQVDIDFGHAKTA